MQRLEAILAASLLLLTSVGAVVAQSEQHGMDHDVAASVGDLEIHHAWARAGARTAKAGAAFLSVVSMSGEADRLVSASSAAAEIVELHTHLNDNGVMRMRQVEAIDIPAGEEVHLAPGGFHIMLIGLTRQLVEGESLDIELVFERAGPVELTVPVMGIGHRGPTHDGKHSMEHGEGHGEMKHGEMKPGQMKHGSGG